MRILIVDDSKGMRGIVRRAIRAASSTSHEMNEAGNGIEALNAIKATPVDLVLTDWNMPEMNGIDFLRELRTAKNEVPVGFITSETTEEMRSQALAAGAAFVLTKPFTTEAVAHALRSVGV